MGGAGGACLRQGTWEAPPGDPGPAAYTCQLNRKLAALCEGLSCRWTR